MVKSADLWRGAERLLQQQRIEFISLEQELPCQGCIGETEIWMGSGVLKLNALFSIISHSQNQIVLCLGCTKAEQQQICEHYQVQGFQCFLVERF